MPKFDWCLVLHAKRCCLFDCMVHGQIHILDFGTYRASLFLYMIKFVYLICVKILNCYKTTMMMTKCKHHESHITFGIEPNGQTQKWEHTSVHAHR